MLSFATVSMLSAGEVTMTLRRQVILWIVVIAAMLIVGTQIGHQSGVFPPPPWPQP